jgi:phage terminase large subunit-like protein
MVPNDENIYVLQMYWLPEDLLETRVREDKIPYDLWEEQGLLRTCPGNKVHYKYVKEWFEEVQREFDIYIYKCGYDSWSATYFVEDMENTFGKSVMEPIQQGKKTLSSPMKSLGADLESKRIIYNNNPILKWCLTNTSIDVDKNDNIQPCKGRLGTRRIDGLAGLLDAYVTLENNLEEYKSVI